MQPFFDFTIISFRKGTAAFLFRRSPLRETGGGTKERMMQKISKK